MPESERKKALILYNPVAGGKVRKRIVKKLKHYAPYFDILSTQYAGHISEIVSLKKDDYDIFIAAGGDGTVNELAAALENTDKILGVLPTGSGNGFANELGFDRNIKYLVKGIESGDFIKIDTLSINNRLFINVSGMGLDSHIAFLFHEGETRGFLSYCFVAIKAMLTYKPLYASINNGNTVVSGKYFILSITNTRQYGNHAIIVPKAIPYDGKYEIMLVKPFPIVLYPVYIFKMFFGWLKESKYISYLECNGNSQIKTENTKFHIDGDPVLLESPVQIQIKHHALKVLKT
ncbi:MAG: YegS/Rv2252/BmrU family lipid kinase [Bacteroidales bacterium]|nr:YegS/Rv2252/BmrU family lipid kinase [Bacteroidales bacterium]